jgi:hypothetical protein
MFASTVLSSIYESIKNLINPNRPAFDLECQLSNSRNAINFLMVDNESLKTENAIISKDYWDLVKEHNKLLNDYEESKKHDEWLNDMLLENSEFTDREEVTAVA